MVEVPDKVLEVLEVLEVVVPEVQKDHDDQVVQVVHVDPVDRVVDEIPVRKENPEILKAQHLMVRKTDLLVEII